MVTPTRRDILRALAAAPLSALSACACRRDYPRGEIADSVTRRLPADVLSPPRLNRRASAAVIDAHAHFVNASDVPVRGFIAESMGHNADSRLRPLIKEAALLAEKFAERAPTAAEELTELEDLARRLSNRTGDWEMQRDAWFRDKRERSAEDVAQIVSGTGFERRYRELVPPQVRRSGRTGITADEVKDAEDQSSGAIDLRARAGVADIVRTAQAFLQFLRLMVTYRAANIRTYVDAFSPTDGAGVDMVLDVLVDFDYWLDCPPRSAHQDQVKLHQYLAAMHGSYVRPVVAYNPWTDIEQDGAARDRVIAAWDTGVFVAAKVYPPMGFMPAGNANSAAATSKPRPDLKRLDEVLAAFFTACAEKGIPVIAHAARSNGRDAAHDDFSSPRAWDALLGRVATQQRRPVISLGHFGGDNPETNWTADFAHLMNVYPTVQLFGDLGYWDRLICDDPSACAAARNRLKDVLKIRVGQSDTVVDRLMFATDWLMLSQVPGWKSYVQRVREGLASIAGDPADVDKILGANARRCFTRLSS